MLVKHFHPLTAEELREVDRIAASGKKSLKNKALPERGKTTIAVERIPGPVNRVAPPNDAVIVPVEHQEPNDQQNADHQPLADQVHIENHHLSSEEDSDVEEQLDEYLSYLTDSEEPSDAPNCDVPSSSQEAASEMPSNLSQQYEDMFD